MSALYSTEILRLATEIPHLGHLDAPQGVAERRSPICGSRVTVEVSLDAEGRIAAYAQTPRACALGQASAAICGAVSPGKMLAELRANRDGLADFLGGKSDQPGPCTALEIFRPARDHPGRHAAIMLPFDAVIEAVETAQQVR